MFVHARQITILDQLKRKPRMSVEALRRNLRVSRSTLRRDLLDLEERGELLRVHGGVLHPDHVRGEPTVDARRTQALPAKRIIEAEAGFWHGSDLNPLKASNWKRKVATCGAFGCLGDLGMHVVHLTLRFKWRPANVRAVLSKVVEERPDGEGGMTACETWDNGTLLGRVKRDGQNFQLTMSMKRIAPGHGNTWFIRVIGTDASIEFTTKNPKEVRTLRYKPGGPQAWASQDTTSSRLTRRSPARSSSSASPTRSSRCGRPSAMKRSTARPR